MLIAEGMADFIGVARKERKEVRWPSKGSDRGQVQEGWQCPEQ